MRFSNKNGDRIKIERGQSENRRMFTNFVTTIFKANGFLCDLSVDTVEAWKTMIYWMTDRSP